MKEWLSADEIAAAKLPHLPRTQRGMSFYAEREGWNEHPSLSKKRKGRGGGLEFHYTLLPALAQVAYTQQNLTVALPGPVAANDEVTTGSTLSARARIERDARVAIVHAYERFASGLAGIKDAGRMAAFCDRYAMGYVKADDWVKEALPRVSVASLKRWRRLIRRGDADALGVDKAAARAGTGVLDTANGGAVRAFILALVAQNSHLAAGQIRTLCRDEFGDQIAAIKGGVEKLVDMPPIRTFQNSLKGFKSTYKVQLTKLQNPDLFRSTMKPSGVGSLRHIIHPNALWQIDASPLDALCLDGRHAVYACIDISTRRTILYFSKTPRATAVALLLRKALEEWGVPDTIKTDNGSDFVAHDTKRLFASLDIEMEISDAYSPEQKGHVERVIGTFQRGFATLVPGFVGHSVADRKAIEGRKSFAKRRGETENETFDVKYTGADMQRLADKWALDLYQHQPHGGLQKRTPFQVNAESDIPVRKVDAAALDLLLMPVVSSGGYRKTTKFGIKIDGFQYATPQILPQVRVFVRMDPNDKGRVLAFDEDGGRYLGEGICPDLAGINPATLLKAVREAHAELVEDSNKQIKKDMKVIARGKPLIERSLNVAARDVPNVFPLPKKRTNHTTPQIAAALDALDTSGNLLQANPLDARTAQKQRDLIAAMEADDMRTLSANTDALIAEVATPKQQPIANNVTRLPETPKQRFVRAVGVLRAIEAGEHAEPQDALWVGQYQTTPEWRAQSKILENFGETYLGA